MKRFVTRWAALALALILAVGLIPAAAANSPFTDVTDRQIAQDVEVLRMLGAIDGVSSTSFNPGGTLTRAQFCKMAIEVLGQGDRVGAYENYTIFPDVKSNHWAAGYVNLAVRGEGKFISGYSDGTFKPDSVITFGQAVTILMRLLGYTDEDVGTVWPEGYLDAAERIGLTDGVKLGGSDAVTRAQAAHLFVSLLNADTKDGGAFLGKLGTPVADVVMLNADTVTADGVPAVLTSNDPANPVPVANKTGSASLSGRKGTLVMSSAGKVVTFVPSSSGSSSDITISGSAIDQITAASGAKFTVRADTVAYYRSEKTTWGEVQPFVHAGTQATIYTGSSGKAEFIYIGESTSDEAVVITRDGSISGLSLLTDRTDYTLYKNGETVTSGAIRKYDVATYNSANNTVYLCDNRFIGYYANVYPNTESPLRIEIAGFEGEFEVLPCAVDSLSKCKLGQTATFLLTQDNKIAGAYSPNTIRGNCVGYVTSLSSGSATVELLCGLTVKGTTSADESLAGQLVNVSSTGKDRLSLSRFSTQSVRGSFDVEKRTVGTAPLAGNVRIYERVGTGAMAEIQISDLPSVVIPASSVDYTRKNYAGKVDILVLNNVTGDRYIYGRIQTRVTEIPGETEEDTTYEYSYELHYAKDGVDTVLGPYKNVSFSRTGQWGGIVPSSDGSKASSYVVLDKVSGVPVSAWRSPELVQYNGTTYTVSDNVMCYNAAAGRWFDSLAEALVFADKVDLYVDKSGVVRGVEAR